MQDYQHASIIRRICSVIYDTFLVIALLLVASLPIVMINQGEAVNNSPLYLIYLLTVMFFYFAWQWRNGGQTLAMVTWKIKIVTAEGKRLSWLQCLIRFSLGIAGLMVISALFDSQHRALHDKFSNTYCIKT